MEQNGAAWTQKKEETQKKLISKMKSELNLSSEQAEKVQDIFTEANKKARPIAEQKKEIYTNAKSQVRNLLTPDQQQQWEAFKTEIKSHLKKDHGW